MAIYLTKEDIEKMCYTASRGLPSDKEIQKDHLEVIPYRKPHSTTNEIGGYLVVNNRTSTAFCSKAVNPQAGAVESGSSNKGIKWTYKDKPVNKFLMIVGCVCLVCAVILIAVVGGAN